MKSGYSNGRTLFKNAGAAGKPSPHGVLKIISTSKHTTTTGKKLYAKPPVGNLQMLPTKK
jgi:hypothetical protein